MRLAENIGCNKSPKIRHLRTIQLRNITTIGKNLLSSKISIYPRNMVNFGPLAAEIHPANFNGFRVLAVLLHSTPAVGVSQTLRH